MADPRAALACGLYVALVAAAASRFTAVLTAPYMDEIFHIPQASRLVALLAHGGLWLKRERCFVLAGLHTARVLRVVRAAGVAALLPVCAPCWSFPPHGLAAAARRTCTCACVCNAPRPVCEACARPRVRDAVCGAAVSGGGGGLQVLRVLPEAVGEHVGPDDHHPPRHLHPLRGHPRRRPRRWPRRRPRRRDGGAAGRRRRLHGRHAPRHEPRVRGAERVCHPPVPVVGAPRRAQVGSRRNT